MEILGVSNENIGVYKKNLGVSNKNMGSPMQKRVKGIFILIKLNFNFLIFKNKIVFKIFFI